MTLSIVWFVDRGVLLDRLLRPRGLRLRRRRAAHDRRPDRPRAAGGDQHHRPGLGRQRGVAGGGRGGHVRRLPAWYATWFSALYLALWLLLAALIVRGVSFEFRGKFDRAGWRATWSWTLTIGRSWRRCCSAWGWATCWPACRSTRRATSPAAFLDLLTPYGLLGRGDPAGPVPAARRDLPGHPVAPASCCDRARVRRPPARRPGGGAGGRVRRLDLRSGQAGHRGDASRWPSRAGGARSRSRWLAQRRRPGGRAFAAHRGGHRRCRRGAVRQPVPDAADLDAPTPAYTLTVDELHVQPVLAAGDDRSSRRSWCRWCCCTRAGPTASSARGWSAHQRSRPRRARPGTSAGVRRGPREGRAVPRRVRAGPHAARSWAPPRRADTPRRQARSVAPRSSGRTAVTE